MWCDLIIKYIAYSWVPFEQLFEHIPVHEYYFLNYFQLKQLNKTTYLFYFEFDLKHLKLLDNVHLE